ncbi:MAG: glycosyltransferase [Actinobacteria bacterium]|nr:glycosyltransferase [Actinomycetota bacterium]
MPDVSVVIAYFRNQATLGAQLEALQGQETARDFEVIVADNENSALLREIVAGFDAYLKIRVVPAFEKGGQCYARNVAARCARSPYLAFCDADDVVSSAWVEALSETLDAGDVLATGLLRLDVINPPHSWKAMITQGASAVITDHVEGEPVLVGPIGYLGYLDFAFGCNIGVRRETFLALGGMDERHIGGSEDVDFSWKAQEAGREIVVNPEAVVDYRLRPGVDEVFAQRRRYFRAQMRMWGISRDLGRPVRGMSLRWALSKSVTVPFEYLRVRKADMETRYAFAFRAGGVVGNLQGQFLERVWNPRIVRDAILRFRSRLPQRRTID